MPKSMDIRKTKKIVVNLKKPGGPAASSSSARPQSKTTSRGGSQSLERKNLPKYFNDSRSSSSRFRAEAGYQQIHRRSMKKKLSFLSFLIILLFLLVTAAIAGFFIFYDKGPTGKSLKLALAAPKEAVAGEDFTLALAYENLDKVSLGQMEVVIEYPENFYFTKSNKKPINEENNVWRLAPLPPGATDIIEVSGYLIGEVKENKDFKVIFHYRPENFSSDFQEDISKKVTIKDSLLKVTASAPEIIEDGAEAEFKVKYKNNSTEVLENLFFNFDLGEAFAVSETDSETAGAAWEIEELKAGEEQEQIIKGTIDSTLANPLEWYFTAGLITNDMESEEAVRYLYKTAGQIKIEAPKVDIILSLADEEQEVGWGEAAGYKIEIVNSGEIEINQAVLKLTFLNDFVDWENFDNQSNAQLDAETNSLVWLSTSGGWTDQLAKIKPGDKLEVNLNIPLQNEPEDLINYSPEELALEAIAALSFKSQEKHKVFSAENLVLPIISSAKLITEAKYYLDQQTKVGSGPLPPVIGETTSYRIYWKLFSGSHGLSDVKIKTTLPPYIIGQEDSAEVTMGSPLEFDGSTKEVIWLIDDLSPNSQVMASFEVAATPDASQVNQLLILTNPTILEATEQQSNNSISQTSNLLTSDLIYDPVAQGNGRVVVD
ncbi:hypothetical protein KJ840_04405 [Patescibacteria group bacterium]|nr:hypothetical protein [Patescibacteria group bacterium]